MVSHVPRHDRQRTWRAWGAHAVTVYLVIKAHANFATGCAFPGIETIAEKSGISERQIIRELKTLEANGYITKQKAGRHNLYTLREKVCIKDASGRPHAVATWDYLPASVRDAVADLKHVMVTGDFGGAKIVNIENLTVNIVNMGDNSINVNVNDQGFSKLPVEMQRILMEMRSKAK